MTHRCELEVREVLTPEAVGYEGRRQRVAVVRQRGKRKDHYLDLAADDILLDGWGLPFEADTEAGIKPTTIITASSSSPRPKSHSQYSQNSQFREAGP
jgi:hypothetical protein